MPASTSACSGSERKREEHAGGPRLGPWRPAGAARARAADEADPAADLRIRSDRRIRRAHAHNSSMSSHLNDHSWPDPVSSSKVVQVFGRNPGSWRQCLVISGGSVASPRRSVRTIASLSPLTRIPTAMLLARFSPQSSASKRSGRTSPCISPARRPSRGSNPGCPSGNLRRTLPDDAADRVLLALDCANESRLGPDPAVLRQCSARRERRSPPRQLALWRGQPRRG